MTKKLLLLCRGGGYDEDEEVKRRVRVFILYNNNSNIGTPQHNAVIRHQNLIYILFSI